MNNRNLSLLGIAALCMVIWAFVQTHIASKPVVGRSAISYLIQGLNTDDIDSIVLGKGEKAITLKREGNSFVLKEKDNYPAVSDKINDLITECLDIRTVELYTENPRNFKDLGVTEEDAEYVIKFFRSDLTLLAGVIVGKRREKRPGSFLRMVTSDKVYVTLKTPRINNNISNYIDHALIAVNCDDIESVTVTLPDTSYTLREDKENGNMIIMEHLPPGKSLDRNNAENVFSVLTNLWFVDVRNKEFLRDKLDFNKQYVCRLKDSTVYRIHIAQRDEKCYITCSTEFTDKESVVKKDRVETEEELKKKEAKLLAREKAVRFQSEHNGWVYEISGLNADNLTKEFQELLDDEERAGADDTKPVSVTETSVED